MMPIVTIALAKGRTSEQKEKAANEITRTLAETMNVDPAKIWIRFDEFDPANFATGGRLHG